MALLLVLLGACSAGTGSPGADGSPATATAAASSASASANPTTTSTTAPTPRPRPTAREVVHDPDSHLLGSRVERTSRGLRVVAWWGCGSDGCRRDQAIVTLAPGRAPAYEPWSERRWYGERRPDRPAAPPGMRGLMVSTVVSLAPGVRALVGGGDGATLFPFQATARSTDGGRTWTTFEVPRVDGERGYLAGEVVLPDGRLLVMVADWSGDRRDRPSRRHHGLWVSDEADWSSFSPYRPASTPPPSEVARGEDLPLAGRWSSLEGLSVDAASGVMWVETQDDRLHVSTDGARTFREIPARP